MLVFDYIVKNPNFHYHSMSTFIPIWG